MSASLPIALLTGNALQAGPLRNILSASGFACQTFRHSADLQRGLGHASFSLLLIAFGAPEVHVIDVIRTVRRAHSRNVPILVLSDTDDEDHVVEALHAGADDFVATPLRVRELQARVLAVSRRKHPGVRQPDDLHAGAYTLHCQTQQATLHNGQRIALTPKEFELAMLMFDNAGQIVSNARIENAVWGRDLPPLSRALSGLVARLRRTLQLYKANGVVVSAIYGRGYRLDVLQGEAGDAPCPPAIT